jgi:hypothetical protein
MYFFFCVPFKLLCRHYVCVWKSSFCTSRSVRFLKFPYSSLDHRIPFAFERWVTFPMTSHFVFQKSSLSLSRARLNPLKLYLFHVHYSRHAACSEFQHYCRYLEVSVEPTVTKENRYNSIQNKCLGWHCWFARLCVDSDRFGQIVNRCRGGMDTLGLHARSDGVQYSRSTAVLCMEWKRGRQAESPTWWATF